MSLFAFILVRIFPYSVQMRENADQNNSEYWHFPAFKTKQNKHVGKKASCKKLYNLSLVHLFNQCNLTHLKIPL